MQGEEELMGNMTPICDFAQAVLVFAREGAHITYVIHYQHSNKYINPKTAPNAISSLLCAYLCGSVDTD